MLAWERGIESSREFAPCAFLEFFHLRLRDFPAHLTPQCGFESSICPQRGRIGTVQIIRLLTQERPNLCIAFHGIVGGQPSQIDLDSPFHDLAGDLYYLTQ